MNKIRLFLIVVVLTIAIGCGGGHSWRHETIPEEAWDRDFTDCLYDAEIAAGGIRVTDQRTRPSKMGKIKFYLEKCMEEKGYYMP